MNAVRKYISDIYSGLATALVGMGVTGRTAFKKPVTMEYPQQKWTVPGGYRGILHNRQEDCIGCLACARACPVDCIHIEIYKRDKDEYGVTSDGTKITQWVPQFDIDMSLCMVCGLCTEVCPTECLTMTDQYELAVGDKRGMYLEFALERDKEIVKRKMAEKEAAAKEAAAAAAAAPAAAPGPAAAGAPAPAAAPAAAPAQADPRAGEAETPKG
jgi:NADH-quinone oxidoreductase subunit I